jgi:hypothetical protein
LKKEDKNKFVNFPMMSLSPKKFNVHLYQKAPFVFACFQASAAPRPENPASEEKDALFGLDTQISILKL